MAWAGLVATADAQNGTAPDTELVEGETPPSTAPDPDPAAEDGDDADGEGPEATTPEPDPESQQDTPHRPTTTTITTTTTPPTVSDADRAEAGSRPEVESDDRSEPDSADRRGPNPLLVAGPSDGRRQLTPDPVDPDGAESDQTATTVATSPETTDDAEVVVRRVVWGLIALAVALTALAVYYWWITRPEPRSSEDEASSGEPDPAPAPRSSIDEEGYEAGGPEGTVDPWLTDSTSTR